MTTQLKKAAPWKLLQLDTGDEQSVLAAAKAVEQEPIDLLINNAGIMDVHGLQDTTKGDLMRHFEVNAVGPFLMTRALLPNLKLAAAQHGQAFVAQITSRMGSITDNGSGGYYGYRASKTALNMLSKSLAIDLKSDNIGVLVLHPGYVNTAIVNFTGTVEPDESVEGLARIIDRATLEDSAKMFHFEGHILPW